MSGEPPSGDGSRPAGGPPSSRRAARERLIALGHWYATRPGADQAAVDALVAADGDLREAARKAREALASEVEWRAGPFAPAYLRALVEVPRERFVRASDIAQSAADVPLLLDDYGLATISAPHAYLLSFRAIDLREGDRVVELGTGTGYGAALAAHVVGPRGAVQTVEIDDRLAARAGRLLGAWPNVELVRGEATETLGRWKGWPKVVVTFAVESVPDAWLRSLEATARMVVPVGPDERQRLVRVERGPGGLVWTDLGAVRYVPDRGPPSRP